MKVGIQSPYLDTFGGGERYVLTLAEFFQNRGDQVDIFWPEGNSAKIKDRFDIDLQKTHFTKPLKNFFETAKYDLMFHLSDGSIPVTFAKKNWIHFQIPFTQKTSLANRLKIMKFKKVIVNSNFTKKFIDKAFGCKSVVIYPPVDIEKFKPGEKENIILTIGRFAKSNPKKHDLMIQAFQSMHLKNWKFVIIGTALPEDQEEVDRIKSLAGKDVKVMPNADFNTIQKSVSEAKVYWHATGFGEDLEKHPVRAEHFGITTVEAMSAGCVPVVFAGGGQLEILEDGKNGFLWKTEEELISKTQELMTHKDLLQDLSKNALASSKKFSKENFNASLEHLLS